MTVLLVVDTVLGACRSAELDTKEAIPSPSIEVAQSGFRVGIHQIEMPRAVGSNLGVNRGCGVVSRQIGYVGHRVRAQPSKLRELLEAHAFKTDLFCDCGEGDCRLSSVADMCCAPSPCTGPADCIGRGEDPRAGEGDEAADPRRCVPARGVDGATRLHYVLERGYPAKKPISACIQERSNAFVAMLCDRKGIRRMPRRHEQPPYLRLSLRARHRARCSYVEHRRARPGVSQAAGNLAGSSSPAQTGVLAPFGWGEVHPPMRPARKAQVEGSVQKKRHYSRSPAVAATSGKSVPAGVEQRNGTQQ